MHFEGVVTINASQEKVWQFLTDPDAVAECVPGLKSVEIIEPGQKFRAVAAIGLGSMRVTFTNDIEWVQLDAPNYAVMKAHGKAPGRVVDVSSEMTLSNNDNGTTDLNWSAEIAVMGTIASLASRLMGSATKKLSGQFFKCVKKKVEA